MSGLYKCIQILVSILKAYDKIIDELTKYKKAEELFGISMAIRHRKTKAPDIYKNFNAKYYDFIISGTDCDIFFLTKTIIYSFL